ncbi:MAG: hypothetical protein JRI99_01235 [Deltaproteobacteria bacterium]|nr:hypothetical protein [Deltaproteobacteria bacterium]
MPEKEKMILSHEPVKGYKTAFNVALTVALIYLGFIFATCNYVTSVRPETRIFVRDQGLQKILP